MTIDTSNSAEHPERIETLGRLGQVRDGRPLRSERQQRNDALDGELGDDLTDHELRLKLADLAGQVYLRCFHRNRAMLKPAESVVVAAMIMALATSDDAIALYDDILEGDQATLGELLAVLERSSAAVKTEMREADRVYNEDEAAVWNGTATPETPRQ